MPEWETRPANQYLPRRATPPTDRRRLKPTLAALRRDAMHPAWSILFFTTLAGAAQGLVVLLALVSCWAWPAPGFLRGRCRGRGAAAGRSGGVLPAPGPQDARLARGADVAHLLDVARGHRAAGLHRAGGRCGGWPWPATRRCPLLPALLVLGSSLCCGTAPR
jgi:hypothetical protein